MDVNGTEGADSLNGTADADVIRGFGGNDQLNGAGGDDELYGGEGDDQLTDNVGGNDRLYGEGGNDTLTIAFPAFTDASSCLADGGAGNDTIIIGNGAASVTALGGEGDDQFLVSSRRNQTFTGGPGQDHYRFTFGIRSVITDFQAGAGGDRLDIAPFYHNGEHSSWNGVGDPFALGYAALSAGSDGGTILWLDRDGGADSLVPFLFLPGTDPLAFTADNFVGMTPVATVAGPPAGGVLQGSLRNDIFAGGQSAHIEASFGEDRVGYQGALADYDIVYVDGSWYVLKADPGGGATMVDRLDQVERVAFSDGEIELLPMAPVQPAAFLESRYPGDVEARPGGGFVLAWADNGFGPAPGIFFQFHDGDGTPLGEARQVFGSSGFGPVEVAFLADGGFVVVGSIADGDARGLIARLFDADGSPRGDGFTVNGTITGDQRLESVASLAAGGFVVGWSNGDASAKGQMFSAEGTKVGPEFAIGAPGYYSTYGTVALTGLEDGGFAASWLIGSDAYMGRFDAAGQPVGAPLKLSSTQLSQYSGLDAATLPDGRALLAWVDNSDVWVRTYDPATDSLGAAVKVNDSRAAYLPDIAVFDDGSFVVAWEHSFFERKTLAQRFDTEGQRVGNEFAISIGEYQPAPEIAALDDGNLVAVWDVGSFSPPFTYGTGLAIIGPPAVADRGSGEILPGLADDIAGRAGTEAADILFGAGGDDLIDGRGGADRIVAGQGGTDIVLGGSGVDRLEIDWSSLDAGISLAGGLVLSSGGGHDGVLVAGVRRVEFRGIEEFVLKGGAAADTLAGGDGNDSLEGGSGNDILRLARGGDDSAFGGAGNDILYFGGALSGDDVADGGDGRDAIVLQGNVTAVLTDTNLFDIESISIQSGANSFFGDTANNFYDYDLTTADGNVAAGQQLIVNAQSLRSGEDFVFDGSAETDGRFLIYGGHGVDILTGGDGADVFFFEGTRWSPSDKVDGGAGRDSMVISAGSGLNHIEFVADSITGIESISLNNLFASDPSQKPSYELVLHNGNVAPGGTLIVNGNSIPLGQVVNVDGSAVQGGNLILFAGGGHDVLTGGAGADLIFGGGGADALTGGAAADTFRYDATSDSNAGLPDLIGDFQTGLDKIDLSRIDANAHVAGNQAFGWIGANAFSGAAGELRLYEQGGYQRIEADTNGDGNADLVIVLQLGTAPLGQGDFLP